MKEIVVAVSFMLLYLPFLVVLLQYQNVFAPLIKLEADYDKVCI